MHRFVAIFAFMVAAMWLVIAAAEFFGNGGIAVVVTSLALAAVFSFAGYRLLTRPPKRFIR